MASVLRTGTVTEQDGTLLVSGWTIDTAGEAVNMLDLVYAVATPEEQALIRNYRT